MIYSLTINIDSEKIVILSEDGSKLTEVPNIVALDNNDKIASVGDTQESLQENLSENWEKIKTKIRFCNLFSQDGFRPELGASAINLLAYLATHATPESQKRWVKDSTNLKIKILGYEKISTGDKELFEYYIQETGLIRIKSVSVNNQATSLDKIRLAEWSAKFGILASYMFMFLLASYLSVFFWGERYSPIPKDEVLSFFVVFMIAVFLLIYFTGFIFIVFWKFATRNLVSNTISRVIIEKNKMGLPKFLMNLLWQNPLSKVGGG